MTDVGVVGLVVAVVAVIVAVLGVGGTLAGILLSTNRDRKQEIKDLRTELGEEIKAVRTELGEEIKAVRTELGEEIKAVRTELGEEIKAVRTELGEEIKAVRTELGEEIKAVRTELGEEIKGIKGDVTVLINQVCLLQKDMAAVKAYIVDRKAGATHEEAQTTALIAQLEADPMAAFQQADGPPPDESEADPAQ